MLIFCIKCSMKKIAVLIMCIVLALNLIFMPAFLRNSVDISKESFAKTVLSLWHCDTVPGGKNSRATILKDIAYEFHQRDKDVYVIINVYDFEEMVQKLKEGEYPDLISFGNNSQDVLPYLMEYKGDVAFFEELESAVSVQGKIMAVPWCYGKYYKICGEKSFLYCKDLTIPFAFIKSAKEENKQEKVEIKNGIEDCYLGGIKNGNAFIGTNRELTKILTRVDNNKMNMPEILEIEEYSDLINAIGICKDSQKVKECQRFLAYLQSEKAQSKVARLNLFSSVGYKLYNGLFLSKFEEIKGNTYFENVFLSKENKEKKIELANKVILGELSVDKFREQVASVN